MGMTARQRALYILSDFLSANVAWFLFNLIRYFTLPYNVGAMSMETYFSMRTIIIGQCLFPLMLVCLHAIFGYYNKVFLKSRLDDVLSSAGVAALGAIIIFFTALFNDKIDDRLGNFEMIVMLWALFFVFTALPRLYITHLATKKLWSRQIAFNAVVVGVSPQAIALARDLETKHRYMGMKVVAFIDPRGHAGNEGKINGLEVHDMAWAQSAGDSVDIDAFIIYPGELNTEETIKIINTLLPSGKQVYMTPDSYHLIAARTRTSRVAGQVLIDVSRADIPSSTANLKRISDVAISSIALLALSPLFAVIAVLIKRDSKGSVIYKQERIGYKKKPFYIYKFRTMSANAEAEGPALSSADDPRVTKIGRFLRKYRIDEFPQFWNVLKGDMSIVGPRPERKYYLDQIIERAPYYNIVHQVRPGITSWGMVKYGYASNVDEMIERLQYELLYIENISFSVDLKILFYTINTVFTGKGV